MRILILGGTVFVSKYLAEYFMNKHHEVYTLNRGTKNQVLGVHFIKCDRYSITNELDGLEFDLIIDNAYKRIEIELLLKSNVKFKDYVFISSSAVYKNSKGIPLTEDCVVGYNDTWGDYGLNKIECERYLLDNVANAYIIRLPYLYGKYNNIYRESFVIDCAINNYSFYLPENDFHLQFLHVSDLARFIEILMLKHPNDQIYNLGNKEAISISSWVKLIYKALGKEVSFNKVSMDIPIRSYFCFHDYEYYLDSSKAYKLMNDFMPLDLGIKDEMDWYLASLDEVRKNPYFSYIEKNLKIVETVLCYLEKDDSYLMLYRNKRENDMNHGYWLGIGGHIEDKEAIDDALVREVYEETGLTLHSFKRRGIVYFINNDYKEKMYLYTSLDFSGTLIECNEGELKYIKKDKIYDLPMYEGDKYFLDRLLNNDNDFFEMALYYKDNKFEGWKEL